MLTENKFSKYLLYAIGEILLVIIGILIALQINNWNEENKTRKEESNILTEMKLALKSDLDYIDFSIKSHKLSTRNLTIIKEQFQLKTTTNDSLNYLYYSLLYTSPVEVTIVPFETLKSKGFDLISNNSLRNKILHYYEQTVKYSMNKEQFISKKFTIEYCTKLFNTVAWYSYKPPNSGMNQIIPNDIESLKKDKVFLNLLNTKIDEFRSQTSAVLQAKEEIQNLLKLIDDEL